MAPQKTYWHLLDQKRMPTEYEIVSSNLLYYPTRGFEVNVPLKQWYQQYQQDSAFTCSSWERFVDPRETTYTMYTDLQTSKEVFVDGLLESIEVNDYDKQLSAAWIQRLEQVLPPFRYPCHGLQMVASYIGQMAPSGRITMAGMFQAADEIRRIQRLAYRLRQLQVRYPEFGRESKARWQKDPLWQPLREVVEKLLVTYDWGESFIGLNLVLKPLVDGLFMLHFARLAGQEGDYVLQQILFSLSEDCQWQQDWSRALVVLVLADAPSQKEVLQGWVNKWYALSAPAVSAFAPLFDDKSERTQVVSFANVISQLTESVTENLSRIGLEWPS